MSSLPAINISSNSKLMVVPLNIPFVDTIDFGTWPGTNYTSLSITGQTIILSNSQIDAWFQASDSTGDHSHNDHKWAPHFIKLNCGNITAGVGFTIYAISEYYMQGTFKVRWVWI